MRKIYIVLFVIFTGSTSYSQNSAQFSSKEYVSALKKVTDVMVNDIASPVAAARYYAYVTLASNEVTSLFQVPANSFSQSLRQFEKLQVSDTLIAKSNASFATVFTVFKMAEKLLPSGSKFSIDADSLTHLAIK